MGARKGESTRKILLTFSAMMRTLELNHGASVGGIGAALAAPSSGTREKG